MVINFPTLLVDIPDKHFLLNFIHILCLICAYIQPNHIKLKQWTPNGAKNVTCRYMIIIVYDIFCCS